MKNRIARGLFVAGALICSASAGSAQSYLPFFANYGYVPTPAQWVQAFQNKQDVLGYAPVNRSGDSMQGKLFTVAPTALGAGFNLQPGTSPTSPSPGDLWTTSSSIFVRIGQTTVNFFGGTSVVQPGTGTLEDVMPVQTATGASKTFATADLYKETRRSNGGTAMTDTFPASTSVGLVNGTRILVTNYDTTATDTISAGNGTQINGLSTDTVGPGRSILYVWDAAAITWRRTLNTGSALLSANNLSDVANPATALANLGGLPLAGGTMTGELVTVASSSGGAGLNIPAGTAPSSPVNGDTWTTSSGVFARYGSATHQLAPTDSPTFTGTTAAPTPTTGDNSTKIATTQFVGTAIAALPIGQGFRNRIINGGMAIDQRNSGSSQSITSAAYTVDRWYASATGGTVTGQRVSNTGPSSSPSQYAYQITGGSGVTAGSFCQRIESSNSYDLAGSSVEIGVNLDDSLLTSIGWSLSYATAQDNFTSTTSISSGTFTVTSSAARYSTTVSVPSAATTGLQLCFTFGAQTSGTLHIGDVQLELGTTATAFERRPSAQDYQYALRYFVEWSATSRADLFSGLCYSSTNALFTALYPVPMRTTPTISSSNIYVLNGSGSLVAGASQALQFPTDKSVEINIGVASGLTAGQGCIMNIGGSSSGGVFSLSAEL